LYRALADIGNSPYDFRKTEAGSTENGSSHASWQLVFNKLAVARRLHLGLQV